MPQPEPRPRDTHPAGVPEHTHRRATLAAGDSGAQVAQVATAVEDSLSNYAENYLLDLPAVILRWV